MMATKTMMLPLYGKRHGNWIVPCATQCWLKETAVAPGHIVKLQGRYLECIGFQDDLLRQPRFTDVTREICELEQRAAWDDYDATIYGFLAGTGRI